MYPETPPGWTRLRERRLGPFPTSVDYRQQDGRPARWRSRTHRKRVSALSRAPGERERRWWWAPRRASWWIGVLFSVGSSCFLLAALPGVAGAIGAGADAAIFFVGSIFFTAAAALQYLEAINADRQLGKPVDANRRPSRVLSIEPGRIDWWATLIQLVGTLLFNLDTFDAMLTGLDAEQQDRLVWAPDALGSVCFLVASYLAFAEAAEAWRRWAPREREWRIGAINLAGSVAFGISAVASYVVPTTGDALDLAAANGFTALGALCFLGGALMLFPEGAEPAPPEPLKAR